MCQGRTILFPSIAPLIVSGAMLVNDRGQASAPGNGPTLAPSSIPRRHLLVSVALSGINGNQPQPITDEGDALVGLTDKP